MAKKRGKKINIKKAVVVKQSPVTESTTSEVIAASLVHQSVFLKVCRLCEAKDGPFLNIFEADKLTAKKIDAVMPFRVSSRIFNNFSLNILKIKQYLFVMIV